MSGQVSETKIKRWALDASDWLWGTVQGAFQEKQTTSQIIVDAIIGMIPLVGDATAARDIIAVSTRLAQEEKKREEVAEWVLLVILLFALIPVFGGVIKGVGRLLLKLGKNAAENQALLKEIVEFLNRVGHGNALKFIKELALLKYERELIQKFNALMDKFIEAMNVMRDKLGWFVSASMKDRMAGWAEQFKTLKRLGGKMIPKALKDLNERLKQVQQAVYRAEWHTVRPGTKNITREAEARLVEEGGKLRYVKPTGPYPKNVAGNPEQALQYFTPKAGWPDLLKKHPDAKSFDRVEAFHGTITAKTLPSTKLTRIIGIGDLNGVKFNYPAGEWWVEGGKLPANAEAWRKPYAVLNNWNHNGWAVTADVPAGTKAWEGKAAEQFNQDTGQFLEGGGTQLFVDLGIDRATSNAIKQAFDKASATLKSGEHFTYSAPNGIKFTLSKTDWEGVNGTIGFPARAIPSGAAHTDRLGNYEIASKTALAGARTSRIGHEEQNQQPGK